MGQSADRCCCSNGAPHPQIVNFGSDGAPAPPQELEPTNRPRGAQVLHAGEGVDPSPAPHNGGPGGAARRPRPRPLGDSLETGEVAEFWGTATETREEGELSGDIGVAEKLQALWAPSPAHLPRGRSAGEDSNNPWDTQNSLWDTRASNNSTASSLADDKYESMSREERHEAKRLVKDFVRTMVRGRRFCVVASSGDQRSCFCSIGRRLDVLKISLDERDKNHREILLSSVTDVLQGRLGREALAAFADDLLVTLCLDTAESITFILPDADAASKFTACLTMFSSRARGAHVPPLRH